ncbi:hypothetical protein GWI33_005075 [Rhynchophorus ferrugineus]|uniref:Uncharacterized protein n=1 Tax=Rhynchophorus ferrugineus TaxID=354439 RepID=A0A834INM1_RHYFE|nr:hypothetical protein GWI33_005075 [Rhynchophorus ferrugineus]
MRLGSGPPAPGLVPRIDSVGGGGGGAALIGFREARNGGRPPNANGWLARHRLVSVASLRSRRTATELMLREQMREVTRGIIIITRKSQDIENLQCVNGEKV